MKTDARTRTELDDAWEVHQRLVLDEIEHPELLENPAWIILRQDAYERFAIAYGLPL